jgi:hypothetical protein
VNADYEWAYRQVDIIVTAIADPGLSSRTVREARKRLRALVEDSRTPAYHKGYMAGRSAAERREKK